MTKRTQLAAMVLAATLAVSGSQQAQADSHNQAASSEAGAQFNLRLKNLSDSELRKLIVKLKARSSSTKSRILKAQLRAARLENKRRRAAAATPSKPSPTPAVQLTQQERQARQLLRGAPAAKSLRLTALEGRIRTSRALLNGVGLQDATRTRLSALLSSDRTELSRRQPAAQPVTVSERQALQLLKGARASTLRTLALQQRIQLGRSLLESGKLTPATHGRLRQFVAADKDVLKARQANQQTTTSKAERRARNLLETSVSPDKLNGLRLRDRIQDTRSLLREPNITRRTRLELQARLDRDLAELRTRGPAQGTTNYADQKAQRLLSDTRRAADLPEPVLQKRLGETRDLLQDPQLSQQYSRQLRVRLSADRLELRRRVVARRSGGISIGIGSGGIDVVIGSPDAKPRLLADRRPSSALQSRQLSHRVRVAQQLLNRGGLSSYDRSRLADMLASDRRELRQRLRARRDQRRAELDRKRRNNQINIVIAPQIEYAPRNDVAAAEADDDAIERQLVAPPTREIDRRYSMDEFRRRPDLRNYMPAVEVDSIRFGTNEHFVREEEIDELERIGEIIERVLAANPEEVFMIEGHTDAVGSDGYNLSLSTRRAEAVKEALLEFFVIKPENLATIGYGEQFLKIPTGEAEQENRRVSVRRITPLLSSR